MTRMPKSLAAALAVFALAAAPATAAEPADPCEPYWDMPAYVDGSLPLVNRTLGGCVIVRHYLNGANRLDFLTLEPGWTYVLENNGDGSKSRVQVEFTETATGRTASIRVEAGKTVIK